MPSKIKRMNEDYNRICMPYCIRKVGEDKYIPLNRLYKPLEISDRDYPEELTNSISNAHTVKITPALAKKISWENRENIDDIFLYRDDCRPWDSKTHMKKYMERLDVLDSIGMRLFF